MLRHLGVCCALCALSLLVLVGVASADYKPIGQFAGPGEEAGQFRTPGRAAVEQASGNLFVADSGNGRVQVFAPNADGGADFLTSFGGGTLSQPWGIAIAEAGGQTSVYVADAGLGEIVKYDSDEAAPPSFTLDADFESPVQGGGAGEVGSFKAALAIDPADGDLLLADNANKLIQRFEADGSFVAAFDGSNGAGAFAGPIDVAVGPGGDVYVVDANGDIASQAGTSKALRYSGSGEYKATLGPVGERERAATVAIHPADGEVAVSGDQDAVFESGPSPFLPALATFDSANQALTSPVLGASAGLNTVSGLAFASATNRLYVVMDYGYWFGTPYGNPQIQVFEETFPPIAVVASVDDIGPHEATVTGSVNPNGKPTEWHYEYKLAGDSDWTSTPAEFAGNGTSPAPAEVTLTGLGANAEYLVRLVATNFDGTSTTAATAFSTPAIPPTAITQEAVTVGSDSAWLRGSVNPNGLPTTYYLEYGTSTGYGSKLPLGGSSSAGKDRDLSLVARKAVGLAPGTTYHYRFVAENSAGVTQGDDVTFTTDATPAPRRVYEMVSPAVKNGASIGTVDPVASGGAVSADGNAVGFMSPNSFAGAPSSGFKNWYGAFRGAGKWDTEPVNLPFWAEPTGGGDGPIFSASSEDLTKALVSTNADPQTGELQPRRNLYLHDLRSGDTVQLTPDAVTGPQNYIPRRVNIADVVRATTADLSHVLIAPLTEATLTPDAGPSSEDVPAFYLVDTSNGELEYVTSASNTLNSAGGRYHHGKNVISSDGNVVFLDQAAAGVHRYDLETGEDVIVNAAEGTGAPLGGADYFLEASRDGRFVFFVSGEQLLPADTSAGADIYRYDAQAPAGSRLTLVTVDSEPADGSGGTDSQLGSMGVSRSGDRLYFRTSGQQLVAGAPTGGGAKLYLWDDGTLSYVATDPMPDEGRWDYAGTTLARAEVADVDPQGNYLVIQAGQSLAPPAGALDPCPVQGGYNCKQVYLYDAAASTPTDPDFRCVSCLPAPHLTPLSAGPYQYDGISNQWMRSPTAMVGDDGTVVFATATPLLPNDTNGPGRDYDASVLPNITSQGQDVYAYRDGELELISTGKSAKGSFPIGISRDGRTIAFLTSERLSGWDIDDNPDAYVARIGGGLPEPPPPPVDCQGDGCLPPPVVPAYVAPASSGAAGPPNVKQRGKQQGKRCPKGKHRVKGKCVKKKKSSKKKSKRDTGSKREGRR